MKKYMKLMSAQNGLKSLEAQLTKKIGEFTVSIHLDYTDNGAVIDISNGRHYHNQVTIPILHWDEIRAAVDELLKEEGS